MPSYLTTQGNSSPFFGWLIRIYLHWFTCKQEWEFLLGSRLTELQPTFSSETIGEPSDSLTTSLTLDCRGPMLLFGRWWFSPLPKAAGFYISPSTPGCCCFSGSWSVDVSFMRLIVPCIQSWSLIDEHPAKQLRSRISVISKFPRGSCC